MNVVPLFSAGIAVVGTLLGVVVTQLFNRKAERERRTEEKVSRWLDERLKICRQLLVLAQQVETTLYDIAALLPDGPEPGAKMREKWNHILVTPDEDLPGVIDQVSRKIIVEGLEEGIEIYGKMLPLEAELTLLTEGDVLTALNEFMDAYLAASAHIETFIPAEGAYAVVSEMRRTRGAFNDTARRDLGLVTATATR